MEKRKDLGAERAAGIRPDLDRPCAAKTHWSAFDSIVNHSAHGEEKGPVYIDRHGGVWSFALQDLGDVWISDELDSARLWRFSDIDVAFPLEGEGNRSKSNFDGIDFAINVTVFGLGLCFGHLQSKQLPIVYTTSSWFPSDGARAID